MNEDKNIKQLLFSIGLARKAGKLVSGTDFVCDAIRNKKIFLVVCSESVSDNTRKKISDCCVGITDQNLSELISRNINRGKE